MARATIKTTKAGKLLTIDERGFFWRDDECLGSTGPVPCSRPDGLTHWVGCDQNPAARVAISAEQAAALMPLVAAARVLALAESDRELAEYDARQAAAAAAGDADSYTAMMARRARSIRPSGPDRTVDTEDSLSITTRR